MLSAVLNIRAVAASVVLLTSLAVPSALAAEQGAGEETSGAEAQAAKGQSLAQAETATEMVRNTTNAVLELIEQAQGYAKEDPERFYQEIEALLSQVVDFESFARSVMAVHYRDATPEQRERFAESFKWGLVRTYSLALTDFSDGKVVVPDPDRPPRNPKRQTVKMEIHASNDVYPVLYSVTQEDDGSWVVRNLIVNGVNMGLTYRNQFNGAMNDPKYGGDMDEVINAWGELLESEGPDLEQDDGGEQDA